METKEKTTRSGRIVKKPERYEPNEKVEDDYKSDEYDSEDDDSDFSGDESESDDDDSEGSLKDFIVEDDSEDE